MRFSRNVPRKQRMMMPEAQISITQVVSCQHFLLRCLIKCIWSGAMYLLGGEHDRPHRTRAEKTSAAHSKTEEKQTGSIDVGGTVAMHSDARCTNVSREVLQVTANPRPRARLVKKSQQIPTITAAPNMQPTASAPLTPTGCIKHSSSSSDSLSTRCQRGG